MVKGLLERAEGVANHRPDEVKQLHMTGLGAVEQVMTRLPSQPV